MIIGGERVIAALQSLVRGFHDRADDFGDLLGKSVQSEINKNPGIKTRAFIEGLNNGQWSQMVSGDRSNVLVGSSIGNANVFYDGFLEFDTRNRDDSTRPGRHYYQYGIENVDFQPLTDEIAHDAFMI